MASNFYDAYTQGLEAELARLRGELATVAAERDALAAALLVFADAGYQIQHDNYMSDNDDEAYWVMPMVRDSQRKHAVELVNAYHNRQRADGDVMLNPEVNG